VPQDGAEREPVQLDAEYADQGRRGEAELAEGQSCSQQTVRGIESINTNRELTDKSSLEPTVRPFREFLDTFPVVCSRIRDAIDIALFAVIT